MHTPSSPLNSRRAGKNPHRGFTLIELLVTIGIVVLLASLLVPVAGRWSAGADSVGCMNNLRQTYMYLTAYSQDNNGVYPAVSDATTGNSWWLTLQNYINTPDQVVGVQKKTIFLCPASLRTYPGRIARRTYGMNCDGLKNTNGVPDWRVPVRPLTQTEAAKTLLIADTKNGPANNGDGYQYFRYDSTPKFTEVVETRHSEKANALFLDGHVEAMDPLSPAMEEAVKRIGN